MTQISEKDFMEVWGAAAHLFGDLFQYDDVKDLPLNTVWSIIDCDDDWIAVPGFHVVNMLGYVVTTKPWSDSSVQAIWSSNDDFDEADVEQ